MKEEMIFCKGGGCTAKLGPGILAAVLEKLPKVKDPNLLIGFESSDDAAVYQITDEIALVQTLDFFPPMVDDPYLFGQIAAANALSDIYAMGAEVKTALNIVCFPESMDLNILGKILQGGSEKVHEAGGILSGGHSISDREIKYGLSVTGIIHPKSILRNNTCLVGDTLILTKPLGIGIICTAKRAGECSEVAYEKAIKSMTTLNKYAAEIIHQYDVHACTDITGFGFLGHLQEMLGDSKGARIDTMHLPYIREAVHYANEFYITSAGQRNRNHVGERVEFRKVPFAIEELLFDPQTSGGLLVSMNPKDVEDVMEELQTLGLPCAVVGTVTEEGKMIVS